jgi:hypothetical protein
MKTPLRYEPDFTDENNTTVKLYDAENRWIGIIFQEDDAQDLIEQIEGVERD